MKSSKLVGLIAIVILVSTLSSGLVVNPADASLLQFGENQVTSNTADQENPDVYEYGYNNFAIVWMDHRNGNWDIYMYYQAYLGNGNWDVQPEVRVTNGQGNNEYPKIYNDTIVYQSDRNGNWDIYMYNITSKVETQITNNTADQANPAIYDLTVVWQDARNTFIDTSVQVYTGGDIYLYNLTTHTEKCLPLPEQNCFSPAISGNRIVYIAELYWRDPYSLIRFVRPYVCSYDLSTGIETDLAAGKIDAIPSNGIHYMNSPAIDGNLVAWTQIGGDWDVAVRDVSTGATWGSAWGNQERPDINGNFVVYQDDSNGNWDVYLYDFANGLLYDATNNTASQENPAMISAEYGNSIVYMDNRHGNWDIYLTAFWFSSGVGAGFTGPTVVSVSPSPTLTLPIGIIYNSGNQGLLTVMVNVTVFAVIAAVGAAAFMAIKQRKSRKPNK